MRPEEILRSYEQKGFARSVGFGARPAVVVIDMILAFTDPESPLGSNLDAEVAAIGEVLTAARARGVPIHYTTVSYSDPDFRDGGRFVEKVPSMRMLRDGTPWVEVDERLALRSGERLLVKKYASAFFGTPLDAELKQLGVDTLVVTGCTTSGCVRATVVDGLQLGYRVIVPREAVGDRSREAHEQNLVDIQGKYGDVVALKDVLERLAGG